MFGTIAVRNRQRPKFSLALTIARRFQAYLIERGLSLRPTVSDARPPIPALITEFTAWYQTHRGVAPPTLRHYARGATAMLNALGADVRMWTPQAVRQFLLAAVTGVRSESTQKLITAMRAFLAGTASSSRKWTYVAGRGQPSGLQARIRSLVVRMATENPTWGYTRIQGAMKNLGHQVGRSRIARILKAAGIPPSRQRPMTWRTFMRAHWPALAAADFFTTEVWTVRGLMTYYTAFVIELHSRRVHVLGSTPHPDDAFVVQAFRGLASEDDVLRTGRFLICDRDPKWSHAMEELLRTAGVRVVRTPAAAPNCNAHAERFVRSIKMECLDRVVPVGEWHLRRLVREFVDHYHGERNHQGIGNELIERPPIQRTTGPVRRRQRLGGVLSYCYRSAA